MQRALETELALNHAVNVLRSVRPVRVGGAITFRTVSRMVAQNQPYRRSDLAELVTAPFAGAPRLEWRAVGSGQLEIWANLLGRELVVGLRLSDDSLRHRPYQSAPSGQPASVGGSSHGAPHRSSRR